MPELGDPHLELALGHADPGELGLELRTSKPGEGRAARTRSGNGLQIGALLDALRTRGRAGGERDRMRIAFGDVERRRRHGSLLCLLMGTRLI
jgi:hypothetical protein